MHNGHWESITKTIEYYEENVPTLVEKKSQQARFPQENVYCKR